MRSWCANALEGTTNTYETAAEDEADRTQQLRLLAALGAWDRALRRDELAAWCIQGTRGSIYTSGARKTWVMYVSGAAIFSSIFPVASVHAGSDFRNDGPL